MREMRGAGIVTVTHVPTDINPADIFTKILSRQLFEQHRRTVLNLVEETSDPSSSHAPSDSGASGTGGVVRHGMGRAARFRPFRLITSV